MNRKILLAENSPGMCFVIQSIVEKEMGLELACVVATGRELLKELENAEFTHLILDIGLNDGSSIRILPEIRAFGPDLKIAIFSTNKHLYEKELREAGIVHSLPKDNFDEELSNSLKRFLFES